MRRKVVASQIGPRQFEFPPNLVASARATAEERDVHPAV